MPRTHPVPTRPPAVAVRREVSAGASAVERAADVAPHWYRGATAEYDQAASDEIRHMGYKIAGFSVNADSGATRSRQAVAERLRHVKGGDVIIAHMNKLVSDTAEGLSVGLPALLRRGLVFVRLNQADVIDTPNASNTPSLRDIGNVDRRRR